MCFMRRPAHYRLNARAEKSFRAAREILTANVGQRRRVRHARNVTENIFSTSREEGGNCYVKPPCTRGKQQVRRAESTSALVKSYSRLRSIIADMTDIQRTIYQMIRDSLRVMDRRASQVHSILLQLTELNIRNKTRDRSSDSVWSSLKV